MHFVQILVPSLEELQAVVSQVVQCVTDIGQSIPCWTAPAEHSSCEWYMYCYYSALLHVYYTPFVQQNQCWPATTNGLFMIVRTS